MIFAEKAENLTNYIKERKLRMEKKFGFIQIGNYFFNIEKIESIKVDNDRDITVFMKDRETIVHTYRGWSREQILTALDTLLYNTGCETRSLDSYLNSSISQQIF